MKFTWPSRLLLLLIHLSLVCFFHCSFVLCPSHSFSSLCFSGVGHRVFRSWSSLSSFIFFLSASSMNIISMLEKNEAIPRVNELEDVCHSEKRSKPTVERFLRIHRRDIHSNDHWYSLSLSVSPNPSHIDIALALRWNVCRFLPFVDETAIKLIQGREEEWNWIKEDRSGSDGENSRRVANTGIIRFLHLTGLSIFDELHRKLRQLIRWNDLFCLFNSLE